MSSNMLVTQLVITNMFSDSSFIYFMLLIKEWFVTVKMFAMILLCVDPYCDYDEVLI